MVTLIQKEYYKCDYCSYTDEDEDDVKEHMIEHQESPIKKEEDVYVCDVCKEEFKRSTYAVTCEDKHKNNNDKRYQAFLEDQQRTKLLCEGNKPNQKKLF